MLFYQKHERPPSLKETINLLEKLECNNLKMIKKNETYNEVTITSFSCHLQAHEILIDATIYTDNMYFIEFKKGGTSCKTGLLSNGKTRKTSCSRKDCLNWPGA